MRQQQISLDLADLVSVDHLVELFVVAVVDLLEHLQHPIDVLAVGVVRWRHPPDLLHDQHILGQSLNGLDKVVPECEQVVFRVDPDALDEFLKMGVMLHEFVDFVLTELIVIEVLEVDLEEMNLLLHLLKDDLVVGVVIDQLEDGREKQFVQAADLVDVGEDHVGLVLSDDLFAEHAHLEVGNDHAEVADVLLFGVDHLLDDESARAGVFY